MADPIKEWQDRAASMTALNLKQIEPALAELDAHLTLRTHILGYGLTQADITVWKILRENRVAHAYIKQSLMVNLSRWFRYIEEAYPQEAVVTIRSKGGEKGEGKKGKEDEGGNYEIGLQEVKGQVVTRFPPEPS